MKKIIYRTKKTDRVKKERGGILTKVILCSVIVSAVLYALLIFVEKSIVDSEDTKQVYVSVKEVPENLLITAENIGGYFALMERPLSAVPDNAVENAAELYGKYTGRMLIWCVLMLHVYTDVAEHTVISDVTWGALAAEIVYAAATRSFTAQSPYTLLFPAAFIMAVSFMSFASGDREIFMLIMLYVYNTGHEPGRYRWFT
jgi:hypothetical protein